MPGKREFRPRIRTSGIKDYRLIIIATEGTCTEKKYFEDMISKEYYFNPRVHIEVLERKEENKSKSSPEYVMQRLDEFRKEYSLKKDDQLWMVIDLDQWGEQKLSLIATQCNQKNYQMAVSNPCFEVWLLLHIKAPEDYTTKELAVLERNEHSRKDRTRIEKELVKVLGSYNKRDPDTAMFLPYIHIAIDRAKSLDNHPEHRWPNSFGTRVYLLVESILGQSKT
ncbi:MAG: RloB domain-containing protein [Anaerolineae bacterium]|nr:RloB domain-containing protein [Anaerolineae bacterium]